MELIGSNQSSIKTWEKKAVKKGKSGVKREKGTITCAVKTKKTKIRTLKLKKGK